MEIDTRGIDLAKWVFQLHGFQACCAADSGQLRRREVTSVCQAMILELVQQIQELEERVKRAEGWIKAFMKRSALCKKISAIDGIGPITATRWWPLSALRQYMLMTKVSIALKRQIILTSHEPGIGPQSIRKQTDPPRSFSVGAVSREFNNPLGLADGQQFDPIAFFLRSADGQRLPGNGDMRIMGTSLPNKDTTFRKPDH